jgi:hypothetical protein
MGRGVETIGFKYLPPVRHDAAINQSNQPTGCWTITSRIGRDMVRKEIVVEMQRLQSPTRCSQLEWDGPVQGIGIQTQGVEKSKKGPAVVGMDSTELILVPKQVAQK